MNTRQLVDTELLAIVDNFPPMQLDDKKLLAARDMVNAALNRMILPEVPVQSRSVSIPSGDGGRTIRCLMIHPETPKPDIAAILHFHGGGHVMGVPEMNQPELMQWAHSLGCLVLSVDYRLAPETPFPGPMDDAYCALRWLNENAEELGIDPMRIAVAGQSAGGAMAACLSLMARDHGEYNIAFQLLESPRLDDNIQRGGNENPCTGEFIWTREDSRFCWNAYLGEANQSPYGTASYAKDLSGLPPAFISVGALDLFVDECMEYTARLIRSAVPAELIVYPGCFHGFQMANEAAITRRARADSLRALENALNS